MDTGPGDPPASPPNAQVSDTGGKVYLGRPEFHGDKLDVLMANPLGYSVRVSNGGTGSGDPLAAYLNIFIDLNNDGVGECSLNFSPGQISPLNLDTWYTYDVLSADWMVHWNCTTAGLGFVAWSYHSLNDIKAELDANHSGYTIANGPRPQESAFAISIGSTNGGSWNQAAGYIDNVSIGGTTYDFEQPVTTTAAVEPEGEGIPFGDPFACDSIEFVGGWGVYAEGTPEQTAFTVPEPPAGYSYANASGYGGWCDVFTINQDHSPLPVTVCWKGTSSGVVGLYHDQPDLTRAWTILPTTQQGENVCASLPAFGGVALLGGGNFGGTMSDGATTIEAPAAVAPAETPVNCQVTTTHAVIFRDEPGGTDISRVIYDATLHATAEQDNWYKVEWLGQQGWISADYVTAVCE